MKTPSDSVSDEHLPSEASFDSIKKALDAEGQRPSEACTCATMPTGEMVMVDRTCVIHGERRTNEASPAESPMIDTEDEDLGNMNVRAGYLQGLAYRNDGRLTDDDREMLRRASRSLVHASRAGDPRTDYPIHRDRLRGFANEVLHIPSAKIVHGLARRIVDAFDSLDQRTDSASPSASFAKPTSEACETCGDVPCDHFRQAMAALGREARPGLKITTSDDVPPDEVWVVSGGETRRVKFR